MVIAFEILSAKNSVFMSFVDFLSMNTDANTSAHLSSTTHKLKLVGLVARLDFTITFKGVIAYSKA
uniref:Uncharacterized protein n=1 Tax=Siphoviridae sp. ct5jB2 TaxID=2825337 RepID=A0A8S5TTV9_9CAUD|nr:MAG TPA: hypothetical protein [Siphoviridae sp. ct5jB2]